MHNDHLIKLGNIEPLRIHPELGKSIWMKLWAIAVNDYGALTALKTQDKAYSYQNLAKAAQALAENLSRLISDPQGKIILVDTHREDFLIPFLAVWQCGGIILPCHGLRFDNSDASEQVKRISTAAISTTNSIHLLNPGLIHGASNAARSTWHSLYLTSGTTGKPKQIVRGWRQALFEGITYAKTAKLKPGQRLGCCVQPTFGAMTKQLIGGLLSGCCHEFYTNNRDPEGDFDVLMLTPSRMNAIHSIANLTSRIISLTGEPINPLCWDRMKAIGGPTGLSVNAFGGTEFGVLANDLRPTMGALPKFRGELLTGKSLQLSGLEPAQRGHSKSSNTGQGIIGIQSAWIAEGEIISQPGSNSDTNFQPFTRNPDGIAIYQTQDAGYLDDEGRLHLLGRASQLIKRHGQWFDTSRLEELLSAISGVDAWIVEFNANAQAILWLQISNGTDIQTINRSLQLGLWDSPLTPKSIHILDQLPLNANGKRDKQALKHCTPTSSVTNPTWIEFIADWIVVGEHAAPWIDGKRTLAEIDMDSLDIIELHLAITARLGVSLNDPIILPHLSLNEIRLAYQAPIKNPVADMHAPTLYWIGEWNPNLVRASAGKITIIYIDPNAYMKIYSKDQPKSLKALANQLASKILTDLENVLKHSDGNQPVCWIGGYSFGANLAHEIGAVLNKKNPEIHIEALLVDPLPAAQVKGYKGIARLKHSYYGVWLNLAKIKARLISDHLLLRTLRRSLLLGHKASNSECATTLWTSEQIRPSSLQAYNLVCKNLTHKGLNTFDHLALSDNPIAVQNWTRQLCDVVLTNSTQHIKHHVTPHALPNQ